MGNIKKTKEAFARLGFTISKQNKPNETDMEAFNFLIETFNKTIEKTIQENRLFAKLYILTLKDYTAQNNNVLSAQKRINEYLCQTTILNACNQLKMQLEHSELDEYFKSLGIKETWIEGQTLEEIRELRKFNNEKLSKVDVKEFLEVADTWEIDNVIALVNSTVTLAIANYKNLD